MDAGEELQRVGVEPEAARVLAALLAQVPAGTLDPEDGAPQTRADVLLQVLLLAARDLRRNAGPLRAVIEGLEGSLAELTEYDAARYWHIRGVCAWRLDDSAFAATRALNTSMRLLLDQKDSARARRYVARVHDTFGQLLHQQGMLSDALRELQSALALRTDGDELGRAITLGNLGRLCIELADYVPAAKYLTEDLAIVDRLSPGLVGVRAQLLSHLGECHLHLQDLDAAHTHFTRSIELAREANDLVATSFATIGLGRVLLARADAPSALRHVRDVLAVLEHTTVPAAVRSGLLAATNKLAADAHLKSGAYDQAIEHYQVAARHLGESSGASPMEYAEVFRGLSLALAAKQQTAESARNLRLALRHLDGTAAEALRLEVERDLQAASRDSWLLHAAGRFIGQQQIEFLLGEAGRVGFRGAKRRVVVLFSDIRGFTSLSEELRADELVVFLNDYLSHMTRCIEQHGGMVDKFIGDAVMAVFPADEAGGSRSIDAALAMREELERFNRYIDRGDPLSIGIGLHGGEVVAGLIGSAQKREYTVIGDVVNTASRLEGMTKQLGASTLVTSAVVTAADRERLLLRPLGKYAPKGKQVGLEVFDVMGVRDRSPASVRALGEIARCEAALGLLVSRAFPTAASAFAELAAETRGTSRTPGYAMLEAHARGFAANPPPPEWAGEIALSGK